MYDDVAFRAAATVTGGIGVGDTPPRCRNVEIPLQTWFPCGVDFAVLGPIEVTVDLGSPGKYEFTPKQLRLETGKLYKLILRNTSSDPHYFTSHAFSQMVFTRKVQVTQQQDGKAVTLAEFKGAIREVEVYPGQSAEWWLVPVAAGRASDLRCDIKTSDGKTHADLGMVGEIVIV